MRVCLAVAAAVLIACGPALAAQPTTTTGPWTGATGFTKPAQPRITTQRPTARDRFTTADDVVAFMNGYRAKPEPKLAADALKAMIRLGVFRDGDTSGMHLGFIAGILGANPTTAEAQIAKMFPLPPEDHAVVIKVIALSGLANWKQLLVTFTERMPTRAVLIERYMSDKLPALADLALDAGPAPLDILWGHYFATGSIEPILRIVSILKWSKDANNTERLTVGSMAKFTLATNASRDMDLLRLLKPLVAVEPKPNAAILREVIEAAEIGDVGRIRKDALSAIETLKVKGSENSRSYAWWGTAGQTALALGCIAGSALGQVGIGIPCVVGGAVSGAAIKAFAPKE